MNAKKSVSAKKKKSTAKTAAAKPKASTAKTVKDQLSTQGGDLPDLNAGAGYPVHPDRIWPD